MKKIIEGKLYNTETAMWIGNASSSLSVTDFNWFEEDMYRTKRGNWFLAGHGGPLSHYAEKCGLTGWNSGEKIIPLTEEAAKKWCEQNLSDEEYMELFEVEEA